LGQVRTRLYRKKFNKPTHHQPMSKQGVKRARKVEHVAPSNPATGRPQLLLVKTELQSWLGKSFCDEAELLPMLLTHSIVRRVRTIDVAVRPLGGDSFKVTLDARRPLVSEAKAEIARVQGTREGKQELYKVATRADGGAVREDDAEPELLDDDDMELRDGELVAMAVKENGFEPLYAEEEHTVDGHTAGVECLVVHGDKLISGSSDGTMKVWSTDTWVCERTLEGHNAVVISLVVHGDKLISGLAETTIKVWKTDTWACERTLQGHIGGVNSLVMHGDKLISGSDDETIKVWSTDTYTRERTLEAHDDTVNSLVVYGDKLISGSEDGSIKVWSTETWVCEHTVGALEGRDDAVLSLLVHGDKLMSGSNGGTIRVWSTDTWACERTLEGHRNAVFSLVVHGDNLISSSDDHTIKVWNIDTWVCERTLEAHDSGVNCLVVHGDKLLSSSDDRKATSYIKVWGS
jgi:hypothetical protein